MILFVVLTYLILDKKVFSHAYLKEKCCKSSEYLKKTNITYSCTENKTKRLGILTNTSNYLENSADGECIDIVNKEFSVFQVSGEQISKGKTISERYFPKCCPLKYIYNSILHSCEKSENMTHDHIKETFIKVGLPTCKLIVDSELEKGTDLYKSIIDVRKKINYCIDENERGNFTLRQCEASIKVCDHIRCIKKCCPDGQSLVNNDCVNTYTNGLDLSFSSRIEQPEDPFAIISNRTCIDIFIMNETRHIFNLDKRGMFKYWMNYSNSYVTEDIAYKFPYCIEHFLRINAKQEREMEEFVFIKCYEDKEYKQKFKYTLVPKILSCVFLGLTIIVYIILKEIRNLFGKILMNYCVTTLLLFSLLVYAHVDLTPTYISCVIRGYAIILSSTLSFAWLNVMCWDIWWTFGSTSCVSPRQRREDLKRLLWYLLYGWGMPILLTLTVFSLSRSTIIPDSIKPHVGETFCFIEDQAGNYAAILFLRLPHLVMLLISTILFFRTIVYCLKVKNDINKMIDTKSEKRSRFEKDKERLSLIVKLSIIMGVTYMFDVISSFIDMSKMGTVPKYTEIVWDFINCLQGVFIFLVFVCKKRVYNDLLKKLKIVKERSSLNNTQSLTLSTRISSQGRIERRPMCS